MTENKRTTRLFVVMALKSFTIPKYFSFKNENIMVIRYNNSENKKSQRRHINYNFNTVRAGLYCSRSTWWSHIVHYCKQNFSGMLVAPLVYEENNKNQTDIIASNSRYD